MTKKKCVACQFPTLKLLAGRTALLQARPDVMLVPCSRQRTVSVFLAVVVVAACHGGKTKPSPAPLQAIALQQRPDGARVFVDEHGRERIFHGTNAVVKGPPWHPDTQTFSRDVSLVEEDFVWMQNMGLNLLRLGVMWPGVEPLRRQYNETYLDQLDDIVTRAAAHGVYTLLDMHQDGLSELFCGEGLPWWTVAQTSVVAQQLAFPAPFDHLNKSAKSTDYYVEDKLPGAPRLPTRSACATHSRGPGWGESTWQAANAYQALWSNTDGILDAWAAMWAKVALRFKGRTEVLGVELMNEPFAGDFYADPRIMLPWPNPFNADARNLQPAYDKISASVREVDTEVLIFFAGVTWGDFGAGFTAPPGGIDFSNRSVLSFHYYAPPQISIPFQFRTQASVSRRLQTGVFLTETGNQNERSSAVADGADAALVSWSGWEWKSFCRPCAQWVSVGSNVSASQFDCWGACKTGFGHAWPSRLPAAPGALPPPHRPMAVRTSAATGRTMHTNPTAPV